MLQNNTYGKINIMFDNLAKMGFVDNEADFRLTINGEEWPLNTHEDKRMFAFALFRYIQRLQEERRSSYRVIQCIGETISEYERRND